MRIKIVVTIKFCAAHRIPLHEGRCKHLHGHNYCVRVWLSQDSAKLSPEGFVFDFKDAKELFGGWIDKHLDHAFIYQQGDSVVEDCLTVFHKATGVAPRCFSIEAPPTAEALSAFLLVRFRAELENFFQNTGDVACTVDGVEVYETDNSGAYAED